MAEPIHNTCGSPSLVLGIGLLQEKWAMLIVWRLMSGPCGFNELSRKGGGLNVTTLSQRLAMLEEAGLLTKTIHSTMPPRTSYELTPAGQALRPVLEGIESWSEKHLPVEKACPLMRELGHEQPTD